jgi:hypothetical protein
VQETSNSVTDAVQIAIGLGTALSTVWGYYVTVLIGLFTAIGALAATGKQIDKSMKSVITFAALVFMIVNLHSLYGTINTVRPVIDYISSHSSELSPLVQNIKPDYWLLLVQPIGIILLLLWLWRY